MKEKIARFVNKKIILFREEDLNRNGKINFKKYNYIILTSNRLPQKIIPILENGNTAERLAITSFLTVKENEDIDLESYNGEVFFGD